MNLWINNKKFKNPETEQSYAKAFNHLKKRGETDADADAFLKTLYEAAEADHAAPFTSDSTQNEPPHVGGEGMEKPKSKKQ